MTNDTQNAGAAQGGAQGGGAQGGAAQAGTAQAGGAAQAGTAQAGGAAQGGAVQGGAGAGQQQPDWRAGLSADARAVVDTKNWRDLDAVVRSYTALERTVGLDKLPLPPKNEKGERDFSKIDYGALGRPEKPDDYQIPVPEGTQLTDTDKAFHSAMRPAFHKAGLNPFQTQVLAETFNTFTAEARKAEETRIAQAMQTSVADLQKEWGGAYKANVELATRAAKAALGQNYERALGELRFADGSFVMDHPLMVRAFNWIGRNVGEDFDFGDGKGANAGGTTTPAEATAEINRLKADKDFIARYNNRKHPEHAAAIERMQRLLTIQNAGRDSGTQA